MKTLYHTAPHMKTLNLTLKSLLVAILLILGVGQTLATTWTVAGDNTTLFGIAWGADNTSNDMTNSSGTVWYKLYTNKTLSKGSVNFKICQNHAWTTSYPSSNYNLSIPANGTYHVMIWFNTSDNSVSAEAVKTWTVAGDNTTLFGSTWSTDNTDCDLSYSSGTTFTWTKNNVELTSGTVEFKICQDHAWTPSYPTSNYSLNIPANGHYNVSISLNMLDHSVSATATRLYAVTLNTNSGTINAGNVTSYTYGVGATLPTNVTRTGYKFGGWYESSTFSGSPVTSISSTATGNKTYYAKWLQSTITATVTPSSIAAYTPTNFTFNLTFNNWVSGQYYTIGNQAGGYFVSPTAITTNTASYTTTDNGSYPVGTLNFPMKLYSSDAASDATLLYTCTLSVVVSSATYNVSVEVSPSGYGTVSESSINASPDDWSSNITATPNPGYKFDSWSNGANVTLNASSTTNPIKIKASAASTLTANFSAATYRVTLNNQSATSVGTEYVDATYKSTTLSTITTPTKTNYTFGGYYTETDGGGTQIIDANGNWLASKAGFTDSNKKSLVTENKTLYAKWTETKYAVTVSVSNPAAASGVIDCSAAGWVASNNGTAQIGNETSVRLCVGAANSGYKWGSWVLTGGVTLASGSLTNPEIFVTATAAGTATYTYDEDLTTTWYIAGDAPGTTAGSPFTGWGTSGIRMEKKTGHSTEEIYYCTVTVNTIATTNSHFPFKIYNYATNKYYQDTGGTGYWITKENNSVTLKNQDNKPNMFFRPYVLGTYEFKVDNTGANPVLTVTWPTINQLQIYSYTPSGGSEQLSGNVIGNYDFGNPSGSIYSKTLSLSAESKYKFKVVYNSDFYGFKTGPDEEHLSGDNNSSYPMTGSSCTNWRMYTDGGDSWIETTVAGNYTFNFNSNDGGETKLSVTYPSIPTNTGTLSLSAVVKGAGSGTSDDPYLVFAGKDMALTVTHSSAPTTNLDHLMYTFFVGEDELQTKASNESDSKTYTHAVGTTAGDTKYALTVKSYYAYGPDGHKVFGNQITSNTIYYKVVPEPTVTLTCNKSDLEIKAGQAYTLTATISLSSGQLPAQPYKFYYKGPNNSDYVDIGCANYKNANTQSYSFGISSTPIGTYQHYAMVADSWGNYWQSNIITTYIYAEYTFNVLKPASWDKMYLYSWKKTTNGSTTIKDQGEYPGEELTATSGGNGCYEVTVRSTYSSAYNGGYQLNNGTNSHKTGDLSASSSDDGKIFALTGATANALTKTESNIVVSGVSSTYGGMAGMPITIAPQISCCDQENLTYTWTITESSAYAGASATNEQSITLTPTQGCRITLNYVVKRNGTAVYTKNGIVVNVGAATDAGIIIRVYKDPQLEVQYSGNTWGSGAPKFHYWYPTENGSTADGYIYPEVVGAQGDGVLIEEGNNWYRYILPSSISIFSFELFNNSVVNRDQCSALDLSRWINDVSESGCYAVWQTVETISGSQRRKLEHLDDCGLFYRVKSEVGENIYYSNEVMQNNDDLSFYANASGTLTLQHYDDTDFSNGHWADVRTLSNPSTSDVQTATFTGSDVTGMLTYTGDFYLWGTCMGYDTCSVHNSETDYMSNRRFTQFDGNSDYVKVGEDYNYYWVDWIRGGFAQHQANSSFNSFWRVDVKATVGNEINHDLANRLGNDKYLSDGMVPTNGANVRFAYNPKTNYFSRAYLQGATERNYRFLCLYGTNVDILKYGTTNEYLAIDEMSDIVTDHWTGVFEDAGDWVYQLDVKADKTSTVVINAPYPNANITENYQYLLGDDHQHNLFGDNSNVSEKITLRLIYDFKTNRLITGWVPDNNQDIAIDLDASVIFTRVADGDLVQLKLTGTNEIKHVQQVYTILEVTETGTTAWNKNGGFFWFSLPYACKISNIFGIGTYGTDWEIQRYRGDLRAQQGWFKESPTFWRTLKKTATLEANRGYVIYLKHAPTFRDNKPARIYFPSDDNQDFTFSSIDTLHTELPYNACTICQGCSSDPSREGNVDYDRRKEDSHWWIGGVPTLQNCTVKSIVNNSSLDQETQLKETIDPLYYYAWTWSGSSSSNNYSAASSASGVTFKASHAYMFQYAGTINWQTATGISGPSSIVRHPAQQEETLLEMEIALGDDNDIFDHTYITLNNNATTDYDMGMDLSKIMNDGPQIYSLVGSYNMAANQLPHSATEVPLGIVFPETGEYQLSLVKGMPAGKSVSIYDAAESREYSMENPVTIYADSAHTSVGRYSVRIQKKQGQITTAADNTLSGTLTVTQADGRLFISGVEGRAEAMLYDMTGKLLYRTLVESGEGIAAPQQGIYLMRVAGQTLKINVR